MTLEIKDAQAVYDDLKADATGTSGGGMRRIRSYARGGVWRSLLWIFARAMATLYQAILGALQRTFLRYYETGAAARSTDGPILDWIADELDLERKPSRKTRGAVVVSREATTGAAPVPAGSIVGTETDSRGNVYNFLADDLVTVADGAASASVAVSAQSVGAAWNVGGGTITEFVTPLPGLDAVTNAEDWISQEGTDVETNGELAARCRLRWEELAWGPGLYESLALRVNGVVSVFVNDCNPRGEGTIDVTIEGTAGDPSPSLIQDVQDEIDGKKVSSDDVLANVPSDKTIDVALTATKHVKTGNLETFAAAVEAAVRAQFRPSSDPRAFRRGENYRRGKIEDAAMDVANCVNAVVGLPLAAEVETGGNEILRLGTLTVTVTTARKL